MTWEPMICNNDHCRTETWMVQRSTDSVDLWHVATTTDARGFDIAASEPVCPYCGTTLAAASILEQSTRLVIRETEQPAFEYATIAR